MDDAAAAQGSSSGLAKPALRKDPSHNASHAHGIVWNEENLAENEKIKAMLPHVKITEPKTPFHELLPDDDIDLEPLALDGGVPEGSNGTGAQANGPAAAAQTRGEDKKKFANARKAHYNMKELLAHKMDVEEEEEEAAAAAANGK